MTILLEHQVPIQVVAEEAGHVALDTTRAYVGRRDSAARKQLDSVRFGASMREKTPAALREITPALSPALSIVDGFAEPDDGEVPEAEMGDYDAQCSARWELLLERNPWFPGVLARGLGRGDDCWLFDSTGRAQKLLWAGHDPRTLVDCGPYQATIADLNAISVFVWENDCESVHASMGDLYFWQQSPSVIQ